MRVLTLIAASAVAFASASLNPSRAEAAPKYDCSCCACIGAHQKAAEAGDPKEQYELARCYSGDAHAGCRPDPGKASYWLWQATVRGYRPPATPTSSVSLELGADYAKKFSDPTSLCEDRGGIRNTDGCLCHGKYIDPAHQICHGQEDSFGLRDWLNRSEHVSDACRTVESNKERAAKGYADRNPTEAYCYYRNLRNGLTPDDFGVFGDSKNPEELKETFDDIEEIAWVNEALLERKAQYDLAGQQLSAAAVAVSHPDPSDPYWNGDNANFIKRGDPNHHSFQQWEDQFNQIQGDATALAEIRSDISVLQNPSCRNPSVAASSPSYYAGRKLLLKCTELQKQFEGASARQEKARKLEIARKLDELRAQADLLERRSPILRTNPHLVSAAAQLLDPPILAGTRPTDPNSPDFKRVFRQNLQREFTQAKKNLWDKSQELSHKYAEGQNITTTTAYLNFRRDVLQDHELIDDLLVSTNPRTRPELRGLAGAECRLQARSLISKGADELEDLAKTSASLILPLGLSSLSLAFVNSGAHLAALGTKAFALGREAAGLKDGFDKLGEAGKRCDLLGAQATASAYGAPAGTSAALRKFQECEKDHLRSTLVTLAGASFSGFGFLKESGELLKGTRALAGSRAGLEEAFEKGKLIDAEWSAKNLKDAGLSQAENLIDTANEAPEKLEKSEALEGSREGEADEPGADTGE